MASRHSCLDITYLNRPDGQPGPLGEQGCENISIVDDQQLILYALEKVLKTETTEVTIAETGKIVIKKLDKCLPMP